MTELSVLHGPWSHSRATSCSLALYKEKVLAAPPEPRFERLMSLDRRAFGDLFHDAMEDTLKAWVKSNKPLGPRAMTYELLGRDEYRHLGAEADEIEERIIAFQQRFRIEEGWSEAERNSWIENQMLGSELKLAIDGNGNPCDFDTCPPDGWRGIIDYVEDSGNDVLTIIDGKNRPAIFNGSELTVDEQLSIYLILALAKFTTFSKFRVGIHYFEFGYTQIIDIDWAQVQTNFKRLQARSRHKESLPESKISPEPGWGKCQYCDYLDSCSAGKTVMEPGALVPTDMASAQEAAKWLMVTDEKIKAVRKALTAFTSEHGPVELDDKTAVGMAVTDGVSWDKNKTFRIIKGLGLKVSDFTSLNLTALKKLKGDHGEAVKAAQSPKQDTKFKIYRSQKQRAVRITPKKGRSVTGNIEASPASSDRKVRGRVKSRTREE